jgi:hypothetical protein
MSQQNATQFDEGNISCTLFRSEAFLSVGSCLDLAFLKPIVAPDGIERFFPAELRMFMRQEMVHVFKELVKKNRKQRQVLIGSPGVGKSLLSFLVALYRVFKEGKVAVYIRKTSNTQEPTSVFFMTKNIDGSISIRSNRLVKRKLLVEDLLEDVLGECAGIASSDCLANLMQDEVLLFLDGLHEGDSELQIPHHYLATSGGHGSIVGESAKLATLVVLGGWQKYDIGKALELTSEMWTHEKKAVGLQSEEARLKGRDSTQGVILPPMVALEKPAPDDTSDVKLTDVDTAASDESSTQADAATFKQEALDDIFFHSGGRIREAILYSQDKIAWRSEKKAVIDKMTKAQAVLSLVETKGSGDPQSPDRVRTMFRNHATYFGSALQIVDSQYFVRLLQNRIELEQYYNAYVHAKSVGLSSAAGCHFEELLHRVMQKHPKPIIGTIQSTGTGAEGVQELSKYSWYWIPSIPNFANIDAALVLKKQDGSATIWCIQYTVAKEHSFNSKTFLLMFLRPVLKTLDLRIDNVSVNLYFVVPHDVFTEFKVPKEVNEAGYEAKTALADCSTIEAVSNVFDNLDFVKQPVVFLSEETDAKRAATTAASR